MEAYPRFQASVPWLLQSSADLRAEKIGDLFQDDLLVAAAHRSSCIVMASSLGTALALPYLLASAFISALHDGLAEAVMLCDVAKPCHLATLNSGEERFLSADETFQLAPYSHIWFVNNVIESNRKKKKHLNHKIQKHNENNETFIWQAL